MVRRADLAQIVLIVAGCLVTGLFAVFLHRELFPEYKIYQDDYLALEEFRSSYTHQPIPIFKAGIKQLVLEKENRGPPVIDRCTSCHVALEVPYFSPTKVERDSSGEVVRELNGWPRLIPNEEYIWAKLDQAIAALRDSESNARLPAGEVQARLKQADTYEALKTAHVGEHVYDVQKVLAMHPLIGKETRPFEFHPIEEYGCTSCHNGNGRGLVTDKAHGPVFDGQYETEFKGPVPKFTESDPDNDPRFARIFNDKPGEHLLFQTDPIYVGALIQAKCMQCHQTSAMELNTVSSALNVLPKDKKVSNLLQQAVQGLQKERAGAVAIKDIDVLTKNYQEGRDLYFSQACYACHRIAGMARGGVGPELTRIGDSYPWYIKESIVWPQADLKTSTMPNMHLDHGTLENLMTFLLAQKGPSQAVAPMVYKTEIQAWEAGRKQPLEKPISPAQMLDVRDAMTIFATEGCAACHRLTGFESNVGYAVEKSKPTFEELDTQKQWFRTLFPELVSGGAYDQAVSGSEIAAKIERYSKELDTRLVGDVRQGALLEEIESKSPGTIESFYSNFAFASRAKDHEFETLIKQEKSPEKVIALRQQQQAWKERVHRVLMMFIQEYGLGRLIGPRPNWSGIFRTDEWLMEHFRNPAAHVPRSLMPAFPFDETKFYALTHMLDVLGVRNRNAIRQEWEKKGFSPDEAYKIHCAQCHGLTMLGNGPAAEWIYPIPKKLRDPEFLRHLTKERAIYSIHHGVGGTPMPPWGEVAADKRATLDEGAEKGPVLNEEEIRLLVEWLYSSLPGAEVIKEQQPLPKWQYEPQDVIEELKKEGGKLQSAPDLSVLFKMSAPLYGAFFPQLGAAEAKQDEVQALFDVMPNSPGSPDEYSYFIKKKYYTPYNIEEGRKFFVLNCAPCHGDEADGSGLRASAMQNAKPRMLTNIDWSQSRDDLRMLRSIKYGVPGTAMTPWGDLTSSLQRLQLVIFIRTLTHEHELRSRLDALIYQTYDTSLFVVEEARIADSQQLQQLQEEQYKLYLQRADLEEQIVAGKDKDSVPESAELYQRTLQGDREIARLRERDQRFQALKAEIKHERELYLNAGVSLINKGVSEALLKDFWEILALNSGRYTFDGKKLSISEDASKREKILQLQGKILQELDTSSVALEKVRVILEGRINSVERTTELAANKADLDSTKKLSERVSKDIDAALQSVQKQQQIVRSLSE